MASVDQSRGRKVVEQSRVTCPFKLIIPCTFQWYMTTYFSIKTAYHLLDRGLVSIVTTTLL